MVFVRAPRLGRSLGRNPALWAERARLRYCAGCFCRQQPARLFMSAPAPDTRLISFNRLMSFCICPLRRLHLAYRLASACLRFATPALGASRPAASGEIGISKACFSNLSLACFHFFLDIFSHYLIAVLIK